MSTPLKKDPARGWRFAEQALEDEADEREDERLSKLSEAELHAEIDRLPGPPPGKEIDAEKILANLDRRAAKMRAAHAAAPAPTPSPATVTALAPKRPRVSVVTVTSLALAAGFALVVGLDDAGPVRAPADDPTREESALHLRRRAEVDCTHQKWDACLQDLNDAKDLDPLGDRAPDVQALRRHATERK